MPVRVRHPFLRHNGGSIRAPHASISLDKLAVARQLYERGDMPARRIASAVGISRELVPRAAARRSRDLTRPWRDGEATRLAGTCADPAASRVVVEFTLEGSEAHADGGNDLREWLEARPVSPNPSPLPCQLVDDLAVCTLPPLLP